MSHAVEAKAHLLRHVSHACAAIAAFSRRLALSRLSKRLEEAIERPRRWVGGHLEPTGLVHRVDSGNLKADSGSDSIV